MIAGAVVDAVLPICGVNPARAGRPSSLAPLVGSSHRGTEVRFEVPIEPEETRVVPYPAHLWRWKTVASYPFSHADHITTLELTAAFCEIRRQARSLRGQKRRYFHVVDSQPIFYVLAKGRSSSRRLNRLARRVAPIALWTLSKWNAASGPSRRFDPAQ